MYSRSVLALKTDRGIAATEIHCADDNFRTDRVNLMTSLMTSVETLAKLAVTRKRVIATAESCTGGLIAGACTEVSGSSAWFDRGFVTYSNNAKQLMLGVTDAVLQTHGAVSEATVIAMAEGAVARSDANIAVSVSGVAGPTGGSAEKPVGTVWIACTGDGFASVASRFVFAGDRQSVRQQAVENAVQLLISCIDSDPL